MSAGRHRWPAIEDPALAQPVDHLDRRRTDAWTIASRFDRVLVFVMEGVTLIMVEHRLRELFRLATRALVMNFGVKLAEGSPEEVMAMPEVKAAYMGVERSK